MKKFYRLWISDEEQPEPRFSLRHDNREHLQDRGEEWTRLMFINSFYITEHEEVADD